MAQHNTHRASGRATTPLLSARNAARSAGGAALLGTVLFGSSLGLGSTAAKAAPAAPAAPAPSATHAAPAASTAPVAPSAVLSTTRTLRWGSAGGSVSDLQAALNDHGADLAVDGKFGPRTYAAVKEYQSDKGLVVDGIVGIKTRTALNGGSASGSGSSVSSGRSSGLVSTARALTGSGYTWGGSSPSTGFDCSGLVRYVYAQHGISVPRTSGGIASGGRWISESEARPGDIVVWSGHVGIYAGNGTVIDASDSKNVVVERGIWGSPQGFVTYR